MNLVIKNLPDSLAEKLALQAKRSGRTIEAEAAAILEGAVSQSGAELDDLQEMVKRFYGGQFPVGAVEGFIAERRRESAAEAKKI